MFTLVPPYTLRSALVKSVAHARSSQSGQRGAAAILDDLREDPEDPFDGAGMSRPTGRPRARNCS